MLPTNPAALIAWHQGETWARGMRLSWPPGAAPYLPWGKPVPQTLPGQEVVKGGRKANRATETPRHAQVLYPQQGSGEPAQGCGVIRMALLPSRTFLQHPHPRPTQCPQGRPWKSLSQQHHWLGQAPGLPEQHLRFPETGSPTRGSWSLQIPGH